MFDDDCHVVDIPKGHGDPAKTHGATPEPAKLPDPSPDRAPRDPQPGRLPSSTSGDGLHQRDHPPVTGAAAPRSQVPHATRTGHEGIKAAAPHDQRINAAKTSDQGTEGIGTHDFDPIRSAREAQDRFHISLDISAELSRIKSERIRGLIGAAADRWRREFDALIEHGAAAPENQVLVVVLIGSESEDQVRESSVEASDADKEILRAIEAKFAKARVPFWTALASLGKVKEWSASLEISAGFFAVKGTGGISVTFGK